MTKLVVSANSYKHLLNLLDKDISGIIIYIDKLSVNSSFYMTKEEIAKIDFKNKEVFLCINKIMHNEDLKLLTTYLEYIKDKNIKILFYDMAVYNIAKRLNVIDKLIIYQDHLNTSILSNNYYLNLGIKGSYLSSDITLEELLDIKKNTSGLIMFTVYGYIPIFYSRRYLITNYLKFIGKDKKDSNYSIESESLKKYIIKEEDYGTTVYTEKPINLINYLDKLNNIDYLVLHSNNILEEEFDSILNKFINRETMKEEECYLGFINTKSIYKVKGE